jgi:hypothetical protein
MRLYHNCLAPWPRFFTRRSNRKGLVTAIHAYTNDQRMLDLPRRSAARPGSACHDPRLPARGPLLVLPERKAGRHGYASLRQTYRRRPPCHSFQATAEVTALKDASGLARDLGYSEEPLVSTSTETPILHVASSHESAEGNSPDNFLNDRPDSPSDSSTDETDRLIKHE